VMFSRDIFCNELVFETRIGSSDDRP